MKAQMFKYNTWILETNPYKLKEYFDSLLMESGFNIEQYCEKMFKPHGFTSLYLLSESHFAIHTFPEENKTYIELSSCIEKPFEVFKSKLMY